MALIRWEPFREAEIMQRQINRLFDQMLSSQESDRLRGDVAHRSDIIAFTPPAEIHETSDAFKLRIELPGLKPDDLDVKVSPEAVEISGERRFETTTEEKGIRRSEFRYGSFGRIIPLSTRIQNDKVQAEFKDGVLCLTLPKAQSEQNRVVKVNLSDSTNGQSQQLGNGHSQPTNEKESLQAEETVPANPQ
ncbi:Hsp20/alpha crystallin family protein [Nostoc punctiforme UO1]|uniref:Hsp20/alpha crystallin family protein n=1 Tax=Nostoc punctiforme TaxID=272131 RepID=UPI0030B7EB70